MTSPKLDIDKAASFVYETFDKSVIPSLMEYIKIPNLSRSYDPEWATNGLLLRAAEHIKSWVDALGVKGLKTEIITLEGKSPIVFSELEGELPYTVFYYGHYDKQPHMKGWFEGMGPTQPVIKDGRLYGRGGADDGYATYGTFLSILANQNQGIKLPRCVMITEGDEESGSGHMPAYLDHLKDRIGTPEICFCLDSGTINYDTFWITNSLRGMMACVLTVDVLKEGVHSGDASGIVPSSFRILRQLIERVEDSKTGIIHSDLYVDVPPNRYKELYDTAAELGDTAIKVFPLVQGVQNVTTNPLKALLGRGWEPKLEVIGASGIPETAVAGNVLRPSTSFKLSFRIPPTLDAEVAKKTITRLLTEDIPYGAKVTLDGWMVANGWNAPTYSNYLSNSIIEASQYFYKKNPLTIAEGGTIPLMGMLSKAFPKSEFIVTGILGPESNAHGPNEFLHIDYTRKLIAAMTLILARVSEHYEDLSTREEKK